MNEYNVGAEPTNMLNDFMESQNCDGVPTVYMFNSSRKFLQALHFAVTVINGLTG